MFNLGTEHANIHVHLGLYVLKMIIIYVKLTLEFKYFSVSNQIIFCPTNEVNKIFKDSPFIQIVKFINNT